MRFGGFTLRHHGAKLGLPTPVDPTGGIVNTYIGSRKETNRQAYKAIEYRDIYPGVTLRLSFEGRAVKADYLVAPGADSRHIEFRYDGLQAKLDNEDLIAGPIRLPAPVVLQGATQLPARYRINRHGWIHFQISGRDPSQPLLIDPYVITRSGYFGGALTDRITAVAVDPAGYIYVAGSTESTDFPSGSIRGRAAGVETFVLKLNPSNFQIVYATYLGGGADDRALAMTVDSSGSVYFAGFTGSTDFPASPAPNGGATDGFIARLTPTGTLQFATFLGGSGSDAANGIALKPDGSVWVVGETDSTNMALVGIPYQALNRGGMDAFLIHVSSSGSILHSGYFGGTGADRAIAVAVDASGEVYFTGATASTNFPAANAFRNFNAGMEDAFVAKLSADGSTLRYSSYLGGSGGVVGQGEVGNWIAVDATGAAIVVGTTGSTNFPTTGSALQPNFGGGATDAFVVKISPAGTSLAYSTFFGGTSTDEGWAGALAPDGAFYFGGNTASTTIPPVDAIQTAQGGDIDGFVAKLSGNLGTLLSFSYLGYTGTDSLSSLALSSSSIVLAGSSSSASWLPSGGFKGWYDGWVMILSEAALGVQMNSNPSGMAFNVSGTGCSPGSSTTPVTLGWSSGASCTITVNSPQGSTDTRYAFQSWSDGSASNPRTIVASAGNPSYTMQFATEHRLTRTVSPAGAGAITGFDGFHTAGSTPSLSVSANSGYQFAGWSGAATGSANPVTITMDGPKAITANFNLLTTFNNPAPVQLTVSGAGCAAGTYSTPVTLAWTPGAVCAIAFPSAQVSGDTRWVFSKWSDGPTSNPRTFTAAPGSVYTLEWNVEYRLTRSILPASSGTVSGSDGFYPASSTVQLIATPNSGYNFTGWSGDATGTANPVSVTMTGPQSITANFAARTTPVTIASNVSSLQFSVSGAGCNPGTYNVPIALAWAEGATCLVTIPATQGADVRWVFQRWADGPTTNPRSISVGALAADYSLEFATQYRLTRSISGQGTVSGADGFYAEGAAIQLTATPAEGYTFTGWSGNIVSTTNPLTLTMNSPATITANFSAAPTTVAIGSNIAAQIVVSGSGCPVGNYTLPVNLIWTNGSECDIATASPQGGPDTRWIFNGWTDGGHTNPRSLIAAPGTTYNIAFTPEHRLVRSIAGQGSISGNNDGFYAEGSTLQLTAIPAAGYQFTGWSGSESGDVNPLTITMDEPKAITANFTAGQSGVTIDANVPIPFTLTGAGCPAGTLTAPYTASLTSGLTCSVTIQPPNLGQDLRWTFVRWSDGVTANPRTIAISPGAVFTAVIAVEYRLTRAFSGSGSISGSDGWYGAGSTVQLSATPAAGYVFAGWSGSVNSQANPLSIVIDGPKTLTAAFTPTSSSVRIETNIPVTFNVAGAGCPAGAYNAPITLNWLTGVACEITLQQPPPGADTRWRFLQWADGPVTNPRLLTAAPGVTYTVVMIPEYRLVRIASGPGSISGSDGFYPAGSNVSLTASPQEGYQFVAWTGAASGSTNPVQVIMDGPKIITALFGGPAVPVRIESTAMVQLEISGPGCPAGSYTAPLTLSWPSGIACNASVPSPQGGGDTRWTFTRWSDNSTANPRSIAAAPGVVYTIVLTAEHRLTRSVSGPGSVSAADGFYAAGSTVQLAANPSAGYQFAGWGGSASGSANPLALVMDGPKAVVASFTIATASVRIESNMALQFVVSGLNCPSGAYSAPAILTWNIGTVCQIAVPSPQGGADTHWVFAGWSDGAAANPRAVAASPGAAYAFLTAAEHRLTRTVTGAGSVSGSDGFYASGSTVSFSATPAPGHQFIGWTGSVTGSANPVSIHVGGPTALVANFAPLPGPAVETLEPLTGSTSSGVFTATFSHGAGANQLYLGYLLFLPTSNVVNYVATGSCLVEYNRISHGMRLVNDAGTDWLGPISGVVISPYAGTLSNSKCTVNIAGSSVSFSGNNMTVRVPITFKNTLTPIMGTFLQTQDVKGNWTGMTQFGNWRLAAGTPRPGPSIVGVANSTTVGSQAVYSITASHSSGSGALSMIHLLLNASIMKGDPCQVVYFPGNNTLNLINDSATDLVSPTGVVPGTAGTIANSRCSINTGQASRSLNSSAVTVTVPLTLQPATFGGEKKVYVNAFDNAGRLTHWVQAAILMVQ